MPRKKKPISVKVAILIDPMGSFDSTPEDEYEQNVEIAQQMLDDTYGEGKYRVDHYQIHCFDAADIRPGTRMVLFDFGGMWMGSDLGDSNARDMVHHAKDNPGILYLVVSSFTWNTIVKWQIEEAGLDGIPNVLSYFDIPRDGDHYKRLPSWFSPEGK